MTSWSLFDQRPALSRAKDALRLILHGGSLSGHDPIHSDPAPHRPWREGDVVIEVSTADMGRVAAHHLARVDMAWCHDHGRMVRWLPDLIWDLPALKELSLTDDRLNAQLFRRGLPSDASYLSISGTGRFTPKGPPNPGLRYLDTCLLYTSDAADD